MSTETPALEGLNEDLFKLAPLESADVAVGLGVVQFRTTMELIEFSKLMASSGCAVPPHLRENPGACLAICTKALRCGFDPFSLAEHSFLSSMQETSGAVVATIAYDSFVIRAIIQAHAPITGPLSYSYSGEGDERRCTVTGTPADGGEPKSVTSPPLGELVAARMEQGVLRGSQLWITKPDQQLGYDTGRDYCRLHHPEILMGWYDKDELAEHSKPKVRETPKVGERLKGGKGDGFSQAGVAKVLGGAASLAINATGTAEPAVSAREARAPAASVRKGAKRKAPKRAKPKKHTAGRIVKRAIAAHAPVVARPEF